MIVGQNIRKYRTEKKLTQKKLGELTGIHEANIRKYELGKQNPKIETIEKIANALDVSVLALLHGEFNQYRLEYHKTSEYKEAERETIGFYATLKILESIYKRAEDVNVDAYKDGQLQYSSNYISIGVGDNKIAISNSTFDKIVENVKSTLISLVELSGQKESEYIKAWECNPDNDFLELHTVEYVKLLLEDKNHETIPYLKPF